MHEAQPKTIRKLSLGLSLDTWAVVFALLAAALIRFGLLPHVPW